MRRLILLTMLAAAPCAIGQVRVGAPVRGGGGSFPHHHSSGFIPVFLSDGFYSGALYSASYPEQPSIVVVQAPPPAAAPIAPPSPAQPLMIELQAGQYVQVNGESAMGEDSAVRSSTPQLHRLSTPKPARASIEPLPVILIFRDGHHEEVASYTIADGTLYSRADYYTDGSWNRKIDLRSLDVAQTMAANQSRGVHFQLPASPNEVITRF